LDENISGRTRLGWLHFCRKYIEGKKSKKKVRKHFKIKFLLSISVILLILLGIFTLPLFKLSTVGLGPKLPSELIKESYNYTDEVNLTLTENSAYTWLIGNMGNLKSVRLDGVVSKEGYAKVYLEHDDKTYLIFDNSRWGAVTGLVVDESLENKFLEVNLSSSPIIMGREGKVRKTTDDVFEFKVLSKFDWNVSYDKLCTRWEINKVKVCYGSFDCCDLFDLGSLGSWNSSLYLSYRKYGSGLKNIVKAQIIYANYSLDIEEPYSEIIYSSVEELEAEFEEVNSFKDACIETCLLDGFDSDSYRLVFVVDGASLRIDNIRYTVEKDSSD
jgi:hypothetical protein